MNASAIVSHDWPSNIPVLNLSSPLPTNNYGNGRARVTHGQTNSYPVFQRVPVYVEGVHRRGNAEDGPMRNNSVRYYLIVNYA